MKDVLLADIATQSAVRKITLCNEIRVCLLSKVSNTKDRVSPHFQTLSKELKIQHAADCS